jgi:hypothetical protein
VADSGALALDPAIQASRVSKLRPRHGSCSFRISSSFDLQNLPVNHFIGLFEASPQIGRNRALQVRSPVGAILPIPQS